MVVWVGLTFARGAAETLVREKVQAVIDAIVLRFWDAMRPRARTRPIPSSTGPDWTGTGWGREFQQAVEDAEGVQPATIELIRGEHATGSQRWTAILWDGDPTEMPTVMADGKDPAAALRLANRKYRERMVREGTVPMWRRR